MDQQLSRIGLMRVVLGLLLTLVSSVLIVFGAVTAFTGFLDLQTERDVYRAQFARGMVAPTNRYYVANRWWGVPEAWYGLGMVVLGVFGFVGLRRLF
jgi:hypothetical protein